MGRDRARHRGAGSTGTDEGGVESAVPQPRGPGSGAETQLVHDLRAGDEAVFAKIVDAWSPSMLRLAQGYVPSRAVAEEVVQEAWLALLKGLEGFEERSSVKTWLFRIVVNIAKTWGQRERRTTPVSALAPFDDDGGGLGDLAAGTVDPARFRGPDDRWPRHWVEPPARWEESPEHALLSRETLAFVQVALHDLPERQRVVVTLRDVEGLSADDVCEMLQLSHGNQRVLLHRGRARLRAALEDFLEAGR